MSKKEKNNIYIKAINYFNDGQMEKALLKCEEGISNSLSNKAILNLKGLLLYLKGDLNAAITTWKINSDFNDDSIAKNYLKDSKKDKERVTIYKEGETLLKKMFIDEAIEKFKVCMESDFNSLNVNSALAVCYLKKGEYSLASVHISKVLEIDRNNSIAIKIAKELDEFAGIKLEIMNKSYLGKKIAIAITLIIIIVICGFSYANLNRNGDSDSIIVNQDKDSEPKTEEQNEISGNNVNEEAEKGETNSNILADTEALKNAIAKEDYESIYTIINPITSTNKLDKNQKESYDKAKEILEVKGTEYFYKKAVALFKENKFELSKGELIKAYTYGSKSYLYQHEMFYLGAVNEKLNDNKGAIDYYETYYRSYKDGSYSESVIYELAILYKQEDLTKSKQYAKELVNKYPKSIYNNKNISDLLK